MIMVSSYFSKITQVLSADGQLPEGFVPSKRAFTKICTNKYAMKIRDAWFSEPKYPVGSTVLIRSGRTRNDKPYFVLETNSRHPTSACKGAKIYKILAAGSVKPIMVEERAIKKLRRKKKK